MVGDMRKERLVVVTVIMVGRRFDWGMLHAVALGLKIGYAISPGIDRMSDRFGW